MIQKSLTNILLLILLCASFASILHACSSSDDSVELVPEPESEPEPELEVVLRPYKYQYNY